MTIARYTTYAFVALSIAITLLGTTVRPDPAQELVEVQLRGSIYE